MSQGGLRPDEDGRLVDRVDELQRRVRELEGDLDRTHRLATLGTLAGSIAHEFNNILTPVLSYAQMALAAPHDRAMMAKALQKAVDGTEKAAQVASAMLGFIRDDSSPGWADVGEVVSDALVCLGRDTPNKDGIRHKVIVPAGMRALIRSVALQQVVMNLVLNAIQAMKPQGGTLEIAAVELGSTWNSEGNGSGASGSRLEIRVSDTGRGIPPEVRSRLFQPLVSSRHEGQTRQGTGLGLSICRRLVEEAGGVIEAQAREGGGTTFRIELPMAPADSLARTAPSASTGQRRASGGSTGPDAAAA